MSSDTTVDFVEQSPVAANYGNWPTLVSAEFGAASHVGLVRPNNEDHYLVVRRTRTREVLLTNLQAPQPTPTAEQAYTISVADGMGGEVFGELASRLALTTAWDLGSRETAWIQNTGPHSLEQMRKKMEAFATLLQEAFQERARERPETSEMGTTLTAGYIVGKQAFIGHAGDSRAYCVRGSEMIRLTRDHTLAEEYKAAGFAVEQVSRLRNVLTHYLAEGQELELDVSQIDLSEGDCILLCTDGLSDLASDEEIAAAVNSAASPQAACDALIALALERGGRDNVTVVIGRFRFPSEDHVRPDGS